MYKISIDFDESSIAWRKNKKRSGSGFQYICGHIRKNGKICKKDTKTVSIIKKRMKNPEYRSAYNIHNDFKSFMGCKQECCIYHQ